jgi:hypothetical protein
MEKITNFDRANKCHTMVYEYSVSVNDDFVAVTGRFENPWLRQVYEGLIISVETFRGLNIKKDDIIRFELPNNFTADDNYSLSLGGVTVKDDYLSPAKVEKIIPSVIAPLTKPIL